MEEPSSSVPVARRGEFLLKWRKTLGWSVGDVALLLDVSERTVAMWESGQQQMPDARWRLFVHEVLAKIKAVEADQDDDDRRGLVVIVTTDQQPIDVVSNQNYAGYALSDDGMFGVVASYSINRATGAPAVHRQQFRVEANGHAIRAFERWEADAKARSMNPAAFAMERWLMRRILAGELAHPHLTKLKEAVAHASAEVDLAVDAPEEKRAKLMRDLDLAIANLMAAVAQATQVAQR
ncbi:helix-turn-helix domain-containing protein [Burkholderia gladioli]|uniref:helix-turn-helix domain-containing protein n=1 Tax=Burkholderia gladioli TaxID=28095 RepID=UPI001C221135|nr:helix-turn-helix transcriptional regulator [Burkholderia gladioli]MBU9198872.1 helix-turn-helix domain-containing protein [Burkholderia gladioli]